MAVSDNIEALIRKINVEDSKKVEGVFDNINDHAKKLYDDNKNNPILKDSFGNSLTSTGYYDKIEHFNRYTFDNSTLNFWLWTTLYNESWVFRRAIDKPAQDEVRCGINIKCDSEYLEQIYDDINNHETELIQILQWGALYGGSIGVIMFDNLDDVDYRNPLNVNTLKQCKAFKIYVTDRWFGVAQFGRETVTDMTNIDFGKPKYYSVTFADGKTITIHHDYILRYEHRDAPKLVKTGQLQGWGYAEGSHIINELSRDDQLKSSIQSLINKSLIEVIKMNGMRGVFMGADADNEEQLKKRLEMVNWARNYNSLTFLDTNDEYSMNEFGGLAGLADILQQNMWQIAAALEMQGVLYGDLKNGWANDVDALERYDETIQNRCKNYYKPVIYKLVKILFLKYGINAKVNFEFNSLLRKKQDEDRMEGLNKFVDLLSKLLGDGVLTPKLYAQSLQTFVSKGIIDFGLTEQEIEKIDDRVEEEMENINLDEEEDGKGEYSM